MPGNGKPLTDPSMQASMYAHNLSAKGNIVKNRSQSKADVENPIKEEDEKLEGRVDNFTSISNVKKGGPKGGPSRHTLLDQLNGAQIIEKPPSHELDPSSQIPNQKKFQIAIVN